MNFSGKQNAFKVDVSFHFYNSYTAIKNNIYRTIKCIKYMIFSKLQFAVEAKRSVAIKAFDSLCNKSRQYMILSKLILLMSVAYVIQTVPLCCRCPVDI